MEAAKERAREGGRLGERVFTKIVHESSCESVHDPSIRESSCIRELDLVRGERGRRRLCVRVFTTLP